MNYTIKNISEGGDFEVYAGTELIATCGTKDMAEGLVKVFEAADKMYNVLSIIIEDCRMALAGEWNRGDAGFIAMRDSAEEAVITYIEARAFDHSSDNEMGIVKMACGADNSNGEPDLFFARFLLSMEDSDPDREGGYLPYELIKNLAVKEGYKPQWCVCGLDPASAVLDLCHWHTIPIYDKNLKEMKPEPLIGSIWYLAMDNSYWVVNSATDAPDPVVTLFELRKPEDDSEDLDPKVTTGREMVNRLWSNIQPQLGHMMVLPRPDATEEED